MTDLSPLPPTFTTTRDELHRLAEHVLAPARHAATGRIGLRPHPNGWGTPPYPVPHGERTLLVHDATLVVQDPEDPRSLPITGLSLAEAAAFADVHLGAPTDVYSPTTALEPTHQPLSVDPPAAAALTSWFLWAQGVLETLVAGVDHQAETPSAIQLWPEHFDLAVDLGDEGTGRRANYGASPGDGGIAQPYLYVGPWSGVTDDAFWNATTFPGAVLTYEELTAGGDATTTALDFLRRGHDLLLGRTP